MRNALKRLKEIEKIVRASTTPEGEREYLNRILPGNRKSLAELMAALETDTLRAIAECDNNDESEEMFIEAVRALQKGGKL